MKDRKYRVTRLIAVAKAATKYIPDPSAIPTPATTQIVAAVVSPSTNPCECKTAPAPRKPIPEMIWAAIRVGSPPSNCATCLEMRECLELAESLIDFPAREVRQPVQAELLNIK